MVLIEHFDTILFDIISPDSSFNESIASAIGQVIESSNQLSESAQCGGFTQLIESVLGDLRDEDVTHLPPAESASG